ncbi:hypothetical protein [Listeria grandensis]|uniref:hypothetical protein n=1 Tax=Listeria grandensis TaxID=1494963 RepID=UPI001C8AEB52|nr:hypothetical protein [Listeria grandensis]
MEAFDFLIALVIARFKLNNDQKNNPPHLAKVDGYQYQFSHRLLTELLIILIDSTFEITVKIASSYLTEI